MCRCVPAPCPQPRLRTGFFSRLTSASFPPKDLNEACTSAGGAVREPAGCVGICGHSGGVEPRDFWP